MSNPVPSPQLGLVEAVKLASSRLTYFKGRSRRSEFWWWMLCVQLLLLVVGLLLPPQQLLLDAVVSTAVMALALSVTVRRLQDTGHSAAWVHVSFAAGIFCHLYPALCLPEFMAEYMDIIESIDPNSTSLTFMTDLQDLVSENMGSLTVYIICSLLWLLASLPVVVFCFMDGQKEANAYGPSPKYKLA